MTMDVLFRVIAVLDALWQQTIRHLKLPVFEYLSVYQTSNELETCKTSSHYIAIYQLARHFLGVAANACSTP